MPSPEYLGQIQGVIGRMAQSSFAIKGWTVTITAALLGFATAGDDRSLAWIAVGAVAVFALLDAWYLAIERNYRALYATAIGEQQPSWNLTAAPVTAGSVAGALLSFSVVLPHGVALAASLAVAVTS